MGYSNLTVLQMNDSHGYFEIHQELFWKGGKEVYKKAGGYPPVSSLVKNVKEGNPGEVIFLDNGDTFHGTFPAVESEGESLIPVLNEMGFDAMTAHWEFAYGPEQLKRLVGKLDYPLLANNCFYSKTGKHVYPSFTTIEKNGLKIGIIGMAASIVDKTMPKYFSKGLHFTLGKKQLKRDIDQLRNRQNVDLVIVLSHLGYPQELKLAEEVEGIDLLLSGHTHNRIHDAVVVNDTIVMQSSCHGSFIGRIDLKIKGKSVKKFEHQLIRVDKSIKPDETVEELVEKELGPYRERLNKTVGHTSIPLNRNRVMETTMDNLLLESLMNATDTDVAFSNGWRYGAPVTKGKITINDLWNIVPTNPPVSVCSIKGSEIWEMMEENLERTFSRNPFQQMGGYVKRCLGLNLYFKIENPAGKRIQELYVDGEKLEQSKEYKAVFITTQGVPSKYGKNRRKKSFKAIDALKRYIDREEKVSPKLRRTIVPI